jgi:methylation protein EvaC
MFSLTSISKIASIFDLEIFDAEKQITHGGSMRYYLTHKNQRKKSKRLKKLMDYEKRLGLDNFKKLKKFEKNCMNSKNSLNQKIKVLSDKYEIYGYGATSKSTTILNFCGISKKEIKGIFDTSHTKIGKLTPLTHIPILNYKKNFNKIKPKVCILFAWNHAIEICKKETQSLKKGMRFICHIDKKFIKNKQYFL